MDKTTFIQQLYSRKQTVHQLRMMAQSLPRTEPFPAILDVFCDTSRPDERLQDQEIAGKILVELQPPCSLALDEVLHAVAPNWNVSIEQLPYYLVEQFGKKAVASTAKSVRKAYAPESCEARALGTVVWWITGDRL